MQDVQFLNYSDNEHYEKITLFGFNKLLTAIRDGSAHRTGAFNGFYEGKKNIEVMTDYERVENDDDVKYKVLSTVAINRFTTGFCVEVFKANGSINTRVMKIAFTIPKPLCLAKYFLIFFRPTWGGYIDNHYFTQNVSIRKESRELFANKLREIVDAVANVEAAGVSFPSKSPTEIFGDEITAKPPVAIVYEDEEDEVEEKKPEVKEEVKGPGSQAKEETKEEKPEEGIPQLVLEEAGSPGTRAPDGRIVGYRPPRYKVIYNPEKGINPPFVEKKHFDFKELYIKGIVCKDNGHLIGYDNRLPWNVKAELSHFKEITTGHVVIMGRKTFESLGNKPLKDRLNLVLTSSPSKYKNTDDVKYITVDVLLPILKKINDEDKEEGKERDFFIIGGKQIFDRLQGYLDEFIISTINRNSSVADKSKAVYFDWNWVKDMKVTETKDFPSKNAANSFVVEFWKVKD